MSTKTTGLRRRGLRYPLPHLSPRGGAALVLFVAACFVSPSTIASKAALDQTPPLTLPFARFAIALAVLLLLCRRSGVRPDLGRTPALLGLTGVALAFICQNLGLLFTSAANATLIIEGAIPIATALLGALLLGETLAGRRLAGLLLAVAGVAAIVLRGTDGGFSAAGSLLSLATAVSFAVYTVVGRRTFGGGVSLSVLTGSIAVGVILLAPCAAVEVAMVGVEPPTLRDGLLVLYLGICGSALTQYLWARGLAHLQATEVAVFGALMPVIGVGAATVFLGEPLTLPQVVGALLVGAGMFVTARADRRTLSSAGQVHRGKTLVRGRRLPGVGHTRSPLRSNPGNPTVPHWSPIRAASQIISVDLPMRGIGPNVQDRSPWGPESR